MYCLNKHLLYKCLKMHICNQNKLVSSLAPSLFTLSMTTSGFTEEKQNLTASTQENMKTLT